MKSNADKIVEKMIKNDAFSKWLGIEVLEVKTGYSRIKMSIRAEMLNGFYIAHGGITYSFADSAFAFASNSQGKHAVSIETSISHLQKLIEGDVIFAEAKEENCTFKTGLYQIRITKENGDLVALFKGTVYRSSKEWKV